MFNAKRLIVISSIAALIFLGSGCTAPETKPEMKKEAVAPAAPQKVEPIYGYVPYDESKDFGIKFQYPKNWKPDAPEKKADSLNITLYAPAENESDTYAENLTVTVIKGDPSESVDTKEILDYMVKKTDEDLSGSIQDFHTKEMGTVMIGGVEARKFLYTGSISNHDQKTDLKGVEFFLYLNHSLYTFVFSAGASKYSSYLLPLQNMMDSVEFSKI